MQSVLDTRVTGTGVIFHPLDGYLGTVQDDTAYLSNGFNATKGCRKVIIESIFPLVQVTTVIDILPITGGTPIASFQLATGATTPRSILPTPIEIDQPVSFRISGLGVVQIAWRIV